MVEHQTPNSLCGGPSRPPDTHGYLGGGGVVFSNESGQLDVIKSVCCGQCQVAEDDSNFCSGWVSMMVFTLIFLLKVQTHRLDKGFVKGEYFGKGTFEC